MNKKIPAIILSASALMAHAAPLAPGTLEPGTLAPGTLAPGTLAPGTLAPGTLELETLELETFVNALYNKMSMKERVAQLRSCFMDDLFDEDGNLDAAKCKELIPYGIGHFSQYASQKPMAANLLRDRVAKVQEWLMTNTPNKIPALFHEEVLTGINTMDATIYPQQIGQACSFNPELAELKTQQTAKAMRAMGGVLSLSPMVDVCRVPTFNRLEESYGEDAYLSAVMGTAFVRGLQMGDLKKGVGACSKHYLGYGGGGDADEKELMEEILLPHETMIRLAGSKALMPGYHAVHGTKCVANKEILMDILRGYLGFDGMVVSDYNAIDQIPGYNSIVERAAAAINGGNDVDFPTGSNYAQLPEAIEKGLVKPEELERAVKSVLLYKFRCGLFDDDAYLYSKDDIVLDTKEERQTAYDIASQSIVLLQNKPHSPLPTSPGGGENILPLSNLKLSTNTQHPTPNTQHPTPNTQQKATLPIGEGLGERLPKILLTGPNANSMWAMCGDYTYPAMAYFWKKTDVGGENPHIVTLKEGMEKSKPEGVTLMYSRGCDWTEEIETLYQELGDERAWEYDILHRKVDSGEKADANEALSMAAQCDVIVAAVGENVMLCGENRDRRGAENGSSVRLPGKQEEYVKRLIATGKPVVLVVFGGHAQVISEIADQCAAVVQAWYPGEEGGNAVADILFGKISPSAKLSVSYPKEEINKAICYNSILPSPLGELEGAVQWPFGYGLSYTTFEYSNLRMDKTAKTTDESFTLSFDVKNTGNMDADEIAQIYLSPKVIGAKECQLSTNTQHPSPNTPIRPIQLQGFTRLSLKKGETKTVTVKLYTEQLGYWSLEPGTLAPGTLEPGTLEPGTLEPGTLPLGTWHIAPGTYTIKVGASSADIRLSSDITLNGDITTKPLRDYYFSEVSVK